MRGHHTRGILSLLLVIALSACGSGVGACVLTVYPEDNPAGEQHCYNKSSDDWCENAAGVFYEDRTCADIGMSGL